MVLQQDEDEEEEEAFAKSMSGYISEK